MKLCPVIKIAVHIGAIGNTTIAGAPPSPGLKQVEISS